MVRSHPPAPVTRSTPRKEAAQAPGGVLLGLGVLRPRRVASSPGPAPAPAPAPAAASPHCLPPHPTPVLPALLPARAPPPPRKEIPPIPLHPARIRIRSDRGEASRIRALDSSPPCLLTRTRVLIFSFLPGGCGFGVVGWCWLISLPRRVWVDLDSVPAFLPCPACDGGVEEEEEEGNVGRGHANEG